MTPFFTILITAYNYGQYIEQAVQTALDQSIARDQFEVLVIDDGSTDNTGDRVASFGSKVRYHFQENAGQAAAFNAGLALAEGEFIAFLDADDYFVAGKLQTIRRFLESNQEIDLLFHPLIQVDENANILGVHPRSYQNQVVVNPLKMFLEGSLPESVPTSGVVARKKLLQQLLPVPLTYRICADSYIHNTVPLIATSIGYLSIPMAHYRLHPSNHFCCFDKKSGRYSSKSADLLHDKMVLDLKSIEDISIRFNIDLGEYLHINKFRLIVQKAVCMSDGGSIAKGLHYFYQNLHCLEKLPIIERVYRVVAISFRLISGPDLFGTIAAKFVNSPIHRMINRLLYKQRVSSS